MKNKKLLKVLETEILLYALKNSNIKSARSFIIRIFGYLRANLDLLQVKEYKKLYDECLIFLKWSNRKDLKCKDILIGKTPIFGKNCLRIVMYVKTNIKSV